MPTIDKNLEKELEQLNITYNLYDDYIRHVDEKNATQISLCIINESVIVKSFRLPKKKVVDLEWIMNKLNSETTYVSFTNNMKKILSSKGYRNSITVYPTTYGIGVFVAFGSRDGIKKIKEDIDNILNEKGIIYKYDTSDAGWVFQYKISKSKENISKMG